MNLTDFRKTPMARVMELVRREARRYGTHIGRSELIGLIPQEALEDAAAWYLQLKDFDRQQVLERRMQTAIKAEAAGASDSSFLEALASADPTPGGGSAAAQAGAMAAALVAMVARLTVGKKKYAAVEKQMASLVEKTDSLRGEFTKSVKRDAAAFEAVMAALKLPKETKKQQTARTKTLQAATLDAARQPLAVARLAVDCLELAQQAAELGNTNAISDAGTAAALARASLQGAGLNVRINVHSLGANKQGAQLLKELHALEKQATKLEAAVDKQIRTRGGFQTE
jgi:glutamate formiminotransferase/formiminotetrahydrofolate cyclodeaminase